MGETHILPLPHLGKLRVGLLEIHKTDDDPDDPEAKWYAVPPDDVPKELLTVEVLGNMMQGNLSQPPHSSTWYRAMEREQKSKPGGANAGISG